MADFFAGRTGQYVHISSASIYAKPVRQVPITESTPTGPNRYLPYATAKWQAEPELLSTQVDRGFPVTVVRPSHTYDDANPPRPRGWTVVDRIERGAEIPVHGDGTSLWTLTHAEDFAVGLVGLLGNPRAIGEIVNITGSDVYTWDQIYTIVADALRVPARCARGIGEVSAGRARLVPAGRNDGLPPPQRDLRHHEDRTVRAFLPALTFSRAAHRMIAWLRSHPASTRPDPPTDAVLFRIVAAYHGARREFAARAE
jgi:nucleoside-diphosphate-sugar epimerase